MLKRALTAVPYCTAGSARDLKGDRQMAESGKPNTGIVDPTVEIYRDFFHRFKKGFLDYLISASLNGDDGKDYFVTLTVARMKKRDIARMQISRDPLWFYTTPASKIIQKGEMPEVDIRMKKPGGSLIAEHFENAFVIRYDAWTLIFSPPTYHVQYQGDDVSLDLTLNSLGTPFWFNQGKAEGCRKTPSTVVWGVEAFCDVEGLLKLKDKEIHVKGSGLVDHGISENLSWVESIWQDFVWFVFEDIYGLLYDVHGTGYKDGGLFLRNEKEYLIVKDHDMDNPQWAYSPVLQHHWPMAVSARAVTDKGILSIEGDATRSQTWGRVNRYKPGLTLPGSDMEVRFTGTFTFDDGRLIQLGKGRGAYEVYASSGGYTC